jgi:hypothetical protein
MRMSRRPVPYLDERAVPAPSRHVAGDLIKLDLSRSAGLEQAEERDSVRTVTHGLIRVLQSAARQWTDQWSRWSKFTRTCIAMAGRPQRRSQAR